ncbi:isoprenylcysteine carboxylmethyltransferase family protein [Mycolicibacterium sp. ND9-15]|uniref:methyltransferase family protein n=1 Tax=Mycolicibacterium sp. ND9-15 TaxID=3042320 RepID=UPI002DD87532|nr:isoprenylcysteine carboxylmethyltransferase family protein [Mycolicibacterium sp. ND9-15]WSE54968.1 isoprenylcysteine carboxylmethyltransferase family protein [Mycolicibacterium sp. ND9-15]
MKALLRPILVGLIEPVVFGLITFLVAGTFDYWQAWLFLAVFAFSACISGVYLLRTHPDALKRRMRAGPTAETRTRQKAFIAGWYLSLVSAFVISALDHRFGWSQVPTAICLIGNVLFALALAMVTLVVIQNSYAAAVVRVEEGQKLVSTGLYGLVRHPMYTGNVILILGIPLALGSYWGLLVLVPAVFVLALRIRDEEKLLQDELDGYREYTQEVPHRLVPGVW